VPLSDRAGMPDWLAWISRLRTGLQPRHCVRVSPASSIPYIPATLYIPATFVQEPSGPMPTRRSCTLFCALAFGAGLTGSPAVPVLQFRVDSMLDRVDALAGDGACRTEDGRCTLRAAIQEANASSGYDTVLVPFGIYFLDTIDHSGENEAARGDLDITDAVELRGIPGGTPDMDRAIITNGFTFDSRLTDILDFPAGTSCPTTDQLGAARPTVRVPGAPRRRDAGAIE